MANPKHLKILRQGVEAWNDWRKNNRDIIPDLTNSSLTNVDLTGADLTDVDFTNADLSDAVLIKSHLILAHLNGAKLIRANLNGANARGAWFTGADLQRAHCNGSSLHGAKFQDAILIEVDFGGAELSQALLDGADLNQARLYETIFGNTDLSRAKNLDICNHLAPCILDHRTLARSGKLPLSFLRGCGLPDTLIEFIPSLLNDPIQFYSCFISYSSKDQDFADRLYADLQNSGVRCWFAPEDLKIGDRFRDRIDESIRLHDKLLIVLSENSVASPWVSDEVESAIERERREERTVLFPIKIDEAVMESEQAWAAAIRRTRHIGDFTGWKDHDLYQKAFDKLLRDLKAEG